MKRWWLPLSLYVVAVMAGCSQGYPTDIEKQRAVSDYDVTRNSAETWLEKLDAVGYEHIRDIEIISANVPANEVSSFIEETHQEYGSILKRNFRGYHVWTGKKLVAWAPNLDESALVEINQSPADDDFYYADPSMFSLIRTSNIFRDHIKKRYILFIYQTDTEKKSDLNEMLVLWKNEVGAWDVVFYKIGDDI